ncbi:MAG: tRNA (N6-threonylcarbamoyladenosine(37)-N6)-methyltransferase TrmO, partial [Vampirovibrionia bacterium]
MEEMNLKPIGYIENSISNRTDMSKEGIKSIIRINEEFIPALKDIEENSHLIMLCYFHKGNRETLQVYPRKFGFSGPNLKGVFATRSPDRPNPIAIIVTRLLKRENNILTIEFSDAIDGTPVIDIKPYSIGLDLVFNTQSLNTKTNFINPTDETIIKYLLQGIKCYVYELDNSLDLGLRTLLKIIRQIKAVPDRTIIEEITTDYSGTALDTVYFYSKFTPGENKIKIDQSQNTQNTFINIKLKSGVMINLTNKNAD